MGEHSENKKGYLKRSLAVTLALVLFVIAVSFFVTGQINYIEEQYSFEELRQEVRKLAETVQSHFQDDREQLSVLAAVAASYDELDSPELWQILDSYVSVGMIDRVEILLPDGAVLTRGAQRVELGGALNFEQEAALGAHITNRVTDLTGSGSYALRHYVPIQKGGRTVALLYGVIQLSSLPRDLPSVSFSYGGSAAVYLIDGATGDFLMDTWHQDTAGNIWELGERTMAPGYDHETLKQGLIDGKTGYVVFVSQTTGAYLYFYYEPLAINQWRLALSVPESTVFAGAATIRRMLNVFLAVEVMLFVVYLLWVLRLARKDTREKQRQLEAVSTTYNIERLLFTAHERRENLAKALEQIAGLTGAGRVVVWIDSPGAQDMTYLYLSSRPGVSLQQSDIHKDAVRLLLEYFKNGHERFTADSPRELHAILPDGAAPDLTSMIAVPVEELDGSVCGLLAASNLKVREANAALLQSIGLSFSMFCHNLRSYNALKELGETDLLSGLNNRNRYELDLAGRLREMEGPRACLYIDLNGLHSINNTLGHAAGDRAIKQAANELLRRFGKAHTYRIGGDEFLAFLPGAGAALAKRQGEALCEALKEAGVQVSVGVAWTEGADAPEALVKDAEERMYQAKQSFYASADLPGRRAGEQPACTE